MKILVIGSSNVDINVLSKTLPKRGETLLGKAIRYSYGGKGANQALACGKLGGDVLFLTCLGNDNHGQNILKNLEAADINCDRIKISDKNPTGTALITIDDNGQNTIVVVSGANAECDAAFLKENDDAFKACDYLLLQMEIPLSAIEYAIRTAYQYGKKIILNPAPAQPQLDSNLYSMLDFFTPNETELDIMSASLGTFKTFEEKVEALLNTGIKNVIVTIGDKGAHLFNKNTQEIVPAYKVKAVDTVGAGDCFNGAFVTALSQNKSIIDAIAFANKAASIAVTRPGAQEAIPTLEEMEINL